jgi:hypothetical protein
MIKVENVDVWGFKHAIRGMRNPLNSWSKIDSGYVEDWSAGKDKPGYTYFKIGNNDLNLMRRLHKAGPEHRKYLRQVFVSMDITCNHTWWAEFDTYKICTTRNSCSKMHKIHAKEFVVDDFSHEGIDEVGEKASEHFNKTIEVLEWLRIKFNETQEKKYWRAIIDLLPMGFNLKATVTMNYENVVNIIRQRENHKMFEWNEFVEVLKDLPYVKDIMEE